MNKTSAPQEVDEKYRVGSLVYTKASLASLFGWMIMANLCFGLFEGNGGAASIPFYLQDNFHVSNLMISILFNFIPMIIGTFMTPIISFQSDRTRSRLGRRIPYILYTAPFLVFFAIALGFSDDIIAFCKVKFTPGSIVGPFAAALGIIGFLTVGWSFFNEFVGTVFYYLTPDVMPRQFLGRFQGATNVAGQILGIFMNTWVNPYQLTHIKAIHVGVSILYFVGFGLVCWRVKEGEYPPVEDVSKEATFLEKTKLYFKECFHHPMYIMIYAVTAASVLSRAMNPAGIFSLHLGQHQSRIQAHAGPASCIALSSDGKCVVSGGSDGLLKFWDNSNLKKPVMLKTLTAQSGAVSSLALSPDGKSLLTGASNGFVEMWNAAEGKRARIFKAHDGGVRCVALSADGASLASGGADKLVKIWDVKTGTCVGTLTGHEDQVNGVAFSGNGDRLVSGGSDKKIIVWDVKAGTALKTIEGSPGPVYTVCFAPALGPAPKEERRQKGKLAAGTEAVLLFLKNVFVNETLFGESQDQLSKILREDGWVISGGRDGETDEVNSGVRIWDANEGKLIPAVENLKTKSLKGHKMAICSVAYKPDIRVILTGSLDESIRVWKPLEIDTVTKKTADDQSFKAFSGYTCGVTGMAAQKTGALLANSSIDGTVHVWDIDQGISLEKGNRYKGNFFMIIGLLLSYPLGVLVDRLNPIKIVLWTTFLGLPTTLIYYFFYYDYVSSLWIDLAMMPILALGGMAALPMMVILYPKTKYGQFSSANAMVRQFLGAFSGLLGAMLLDYMTADSFDTDNYRYGYLIKFAANTASFACLVGVYVYWKKLGGEKFVAPEHGKSDGNAI
ncbi:MAG: MFS transporter [Verrucomicrobiota bacterium]|nr:MFS transporter [Verrucomicrobiota bacterium]